MPRTLEQKDPEKAARILEKLADPINRPSYEKIAAEEGVSARTVEL
jgi:hypothetical protein